MTFQFRTPVWAVAVADTRRTFMLADGRQVHEECERLVQTPTGFAAGAGSSYAVVRSGLMALSDEAAHDPSGSAAVLRGAGLHRLRGAMSDAEYHRALTKRTGVDWQGESGSRFSVIGARDGALWAARVNDEGALLAAHGGDGRQLFCNIGWPVGLPDAARRAGLALVRRTVEGAEPPRRPGCREMVRAAARLLLLCREHVETVSGVLHVGALLRTPDGSVAKRMLRQPAARLAGAEVGQIASLFTSPGECDLPASAPGDDSFIECPSQLQDELTWSEDGNVPAGWQAEVWVCETGTGCEPLDGAQLSGDADSGFTTTRLDNVKTGTELTYERNYAVRIKNSYGQVIDKDEVSASTQYASCPT